MYSTGSDRKDVLKDFKLGRLDVGKFLSLIPGYTSSCQGSYTSMLVITSFDLARGDIDLIDSLAWSVIIIDEAHRVKNPRSKLTIAFDRFTCNCRFGLTGTGKSTVSSCSGVIAYTKAPIPAIQNDYSELWTILNWTNPGALGTPKQWEGFVARPLTRGQSKSATPEERVTAVVRCGIS